MESITEIIADFEKRINDLQRDNEGLIQTLNCVSAGVKRIKQKGQYVRRGISNES